MTYYTTLASIKGPQGEQGPRGLPGLDAVATDAGVGAYVSAVGSATRTAVDAAIAPRQSLGSVVVFDGDSVTERPVGGNLTGPSLAWYATLQSAGKIRLAGIAAVSGRTIAQMVTGFDAGVAPLNPEVVHLIAGTNDANDATATPVATFLTSLAAYHAKCSAIGARLVLGTIPPNIGTSSRFSRTVAYNQALREYAARNGVPLIDYYGLLVDPATGGFLSAYNSDNTHPSNLGNRDMGRLCANTLGPILPPGTVWLPQSNADPSNMIVGGLFLGTAGSGTTLIPDAWSMSPSSHASGITGSLVSDPSIIGNWWKLTLAGASSGELDYQNLYAGRVIPNHVYEFVGRVKTNGLRNADSGAGATYLLTARFNGQNGITGYDFRILSATGYDVEGVFCKRFTAPADASSLQVQSSVSVTTSATCDVSIAQFGLRDLTALGLV